MPEIAENLFDQAIEEMTEETPVTGWLEKPFKQVVVENIKTDKGDFDLDRVRALEPIIDTLFENNRTYVLKGAQIGFSTIGMAAGLYLPLVRKRHAGYFLPTKVFGDRFHETRFRPLLRKDDLLRREIHSTKTDGLMRARDHFLYMLGLFGNNDVISIPLDGEIFDEVDLLDEDNMLWAEDRIAASDLGWQLFFSVGMAPGLGIDAGYQASDRRQFCFKCSHCKKDDQILEDLFPECIRRKNKRSPYQRVCMKCGKELKITDGRWVAEFPSFAAAGYRIPQLIVDLIPLDRIMDRWERARGDKKRLAKFNCSTLAKPDAGDLQALTVEGIKAASRDYHITTSALWSVIGVDVGDFCHIAVADKVDGCLRFLYFETIHSDRLEARISQLIGSMSALCLVMDAKPFRNMVRRIYRKTPNISYLQYFKGQVSKEDEEEHEGVQYKTIQSDRDDSIEEFCTLFPDKVMIPKFFRNQNIEDSEVGQHLLKGSQKEAGLDRMTGKMVYHFRKVVPNHYLMAMHNAMIGAKLFKSIQERGQTGFTILPNIMPRREAPR